MKKVRLYTRLVGNEYIVINEETEYFYAKLLSNELAEVVRLSLEKYLNKTNK